MIRVRHAKGEGASSQQSRTTERGNRFNTFDEVLAAICTPSPPAPLFSRRAFDPDAHTHRVNMDVHFAVLEYRIPKFMFGTRNYGDIPSLLNAADGDPWDVFVPGYTHRLPTNVLYRIKSVIGVFQLNDGNHKIAIRVYKPGYDPDRAQRETKRYCASYTNFTKIEGVFLIQNGF